MNTTLKILCGLSTLALLSGCSNVLKPSSQSVGALQDQSGLPYQKIMDQKAAQATIIRKYVPVPIPGQLMKKPEHHKIKKEKPLVDKAAVKAANKKALQIPNANDYFNAMMTYNFMPGAMYTIYTAPMRITDIALQPGEQIISEAAGDTLRWQVSQTYSGTGSAKQYHILVKPNDPNLENTLIITTNLRVYHLMLKSTDNDTYMMEVKWNYPSNMVHFFHKDSSPIAPAAAHEALQLNLSNLNFDYKFGLSKGNKPGWYPVRVLDNGRQTFIEFPKSFKSDNLPILYLADDAGQYGTAINWRLKGRYMIVDTIIKKARLETGIKSRNNQTVVQIERT